MSGKWLSPRILNLRAGNVGTQNGGAIDGRARDVLGGWKCRGNREESPGVVCRRGRGPWALKGCLCVILVDLFDLSCVLVALFFS